MYVCVCLESKNTRHDLQQLLAIQKPENTNQTTGVQASTVNRRIWQNNNHSPIQMSFRNIIVHQNLAEKTTPNRNYFRRVVSQQVMGFFSAGKCSPRPDGLPTHLPSRPSVSFPSESAGWRFGSRKLDTHPKKKQGPK